LIILFTGSKDGQKTSLSAWRTISEKRTNGAMTGTAPGKGPTPTQRQLAGRAILLDLHVQPVCPIANTQVVFLK
jgi:hypothetical protein